MAMHGYDNASLGLWHLGVTSCVMRRFLSEFTPFSSARVASISAFHVISSVERFDGLRNKMFRNTVCYIKLKVPPQYYKLLKLKDKYYLHVDKRLSSTRWTTL